MVDLDGSFSYSKIIAIDNDRTHILTIKVFPNPASNQLIIEHRNILGGLNFSITDINGRKYRIKSAQNGEQTAFDVTSLPNGLYFIECGNKMDKMTMKFNKQ